MSNPAVIDTQNHNNNNNKTTMKRVTLLLGLLGSVGRTGGGALELTEANYDAETKGKYVFLKFYAPW